MRLEKVSIIIPVYNKEKYIKRCFESVMGQAVVNLEVIVVNDGSTDSSEKIINQYLDKMNLIYLKKENGGLSSARNYGLKHATGDYIFFLDPDDRLNDSAIMLLLQNAKDFDIIIGNFQHLNEDGDILPDFLIENKEFTAEDMQTDSVYDYLYGRCYGISACNKLYRHSFLKECKILFQPNNEIYAEDLLFNIKLLTYNPKIRILDKRTYFYYKNKDSITYNYKYRLAERFVTLINDYINTLGMRADIICFTICNAINSVSRQEKNITDIKKSVNIILKGIDYVSYLNLDFVKKISRKRKYDYYLIIFGVKKCRFFLYRYLWCKNKLLG